jgi:hypothetical protein
MGSGLKIELFQSLPVIFYGRLFGEMKKHQKMFSRCSDDTIPFRKGQGEIWIEARQAGGILKTIYYPLSFGEEYI